jgi:1,4-dihydroxy-2-naphthoate octaprenyltransferase
LGCPSTTLIAKILSVNNACDLEGDGKAGRRTPAIVPALPHAERMIHLQAAATLTLAVALVPLDVLPMSALAPIALTGVFALARVRPDARAASRTRPSLPGWAAFRPYSSFTRWRSSSPSRWARC